MSSDQNGVDASRPLTVRIVEGSLPPVDAAAEVTVRPIAGGSSRPVAADSATISAPSRTVVSSVAMHPASSVANRTPASRIDAAVLSGFFGMSGNVAEKWLSVGAEQQRAASRWEGRNAASGGSSLADQSSVSDTFAPPFTDAGTVPASHDGFGR